MSATLSIVIPAYNEERFIGTLLERIRAVDLAPLGLDDGDHRRRRLLARSHRRDVSAVAGVRVHRHARNGGKGKAVRAGIGLATGDS